MRSTVKQDGEVYLDRQGIGLLRPHEQEIVQRGGKIQKRMEVEKPKEDRDALPPWWWNPGNPLAATLPANVSFARFQEVRKQLQAVDGNLDITFNGEDKVWQVWYFKPGLMKESPWTNGWFHLKDFQPWQGTPYIVKTIKAMDKINRSMKEHYREVLRQRELAKEKRRLDFIDDVKHKAGEVFDHFRISNIGKGSKFVNHHA